MAGDKGKSFFALSPDKEEWTDSQRLAEKYGVGAVIFGHTHAARFKIEGPLTYVNTGTWMIRARSRTT